jgi:hypothetical protein
MGVRRLTARFSYCVVSLAAAGPLTKCSAEFLECRELYLRFPMGQKKCYVHYKDILNSRGTSFSFFGTDVLSGDLLPRCKLPNIDLFKERTKE